uniref:Uncharacterized protein n=1 Tax=Setaria digitata TaxID=48799 RepID=A0A915PKN3_9BILA
MLLIEERLLSYNKPNECRRSRNDERIFTATELFQHSNNSDWNGTQSASDNAENSNTLLQKILDAAGGAP